MRRREFIKYLICMMAQGTSLSHALDAMAKNYIKSPLQLDGNIKDYLHKMRYFYNPDLDDVHLVSKDLALLHSSVKKLKKVQSIVGYGNFHLISFDDAIKIARRYRTAKRFTKPELNFLEELFYRDASEYGFEGSKPVHKLTDRINRKNVFRHRGSGHYLFKNESLETFLQIQSDLGDKVVLTSGIRAIAKQFLLFLDKTARSDGNLSLASRQLAPPG